VVLEASWIQEHSEAPDSIKSLYRDRTKFGETSRSPRLRTPVGARWASLQRGGLGQLMRSGPGLEQL
jgi:hypothetical protein